MRDKITKRRVDALKPNPAKDEYLWDTEAKGFGFRVKPSGARSFVLSYYAPGLHQVRRRLTIGAYGPLTVEEARKKALELLARIANGEDPALQEADSRRAIRDETVAALFPLYLQDGLDLRRPRTLANYETLGRLHILPALGHLPVARVTSKDVTDLHRSMRANPTNANRVLQLLKAFFYWLERRELFRGDNPAVRTERYPEKLRERFLTVEETARLGDALRIAETKGLPPAPQHRKRSGSKRARNPGMFSTEIRPANPTAVAALRLLILTGWREKEALALRWDAVNFESSTATLEETKTGRSVRSLSAAALKLIATQPRVADSDFVFPGKVPGRPIQEIQRLWYAVRNAADLQDVRLHDLRHSVASTAAAQGHSLFLIGKLLGHKDLRSTARYAHLTDDARKTMADSVADAITLASVDTSNPATDRHFKTGHHDDGLRLVIGSA
jgi:integrase